MDNINIDNLKNINSITNVGSSTSVSSSAKTDNSSIISKNKPELLEQLGITNEEYLALCRANADFSTMSLEKQLEFIQKFNKQSVETPAESAAEAQTSAETIVAAQEETTTPSAETATAAQANTDEAVEAQTANDNNSLYTEDGVFNSAAYSNLSLKEKMNVYVEEYAKNAFMFADNENPKSTEDWNALSDKEKTDYLKSTKTALREKLNTLLQNSDQKIVNSALDSAMTDLQASNSVNYRVAQFYGQEPCTDSNGKTFYIQDKQRDEYVYDYLKDITIEEEFKAQSAKESGKAVPASNLSEIDRARFETQNNRCEAVNYLKNDGSQACPNDVEQYLKDNNITELELDYEYLSTKFENEGQLSDAEMKRLQNAEKYLKNESYQTALKEYKARGLENLQKEYDECISKGDGQRAEQIKKVLDSKESQDVRAWLKDKANAEVCQDTEVPEIYNEFKKSPVGELFQSVSGAKERAELLMGYLAQNYKPGSKEWENAAADLVKGFRNSNDPCAIDVQIQLATLIANYSNCQPVLDASNLGAVEVALEESTPDGKGFKRLTDNVSRRQTEEYNNSNTTENKEGITSRIIQTQNRVGNSGDDEAIKIMIDNHSPLYSKNTEIGKGAIDSVMNMTNPEAQYNANTKINQTANEEVKAYGATESYNAKEGWQVRTAELYTDGSKVATEAYVNNDTYSKFAKSEQVEGYALANKRVEENFDGDEKIALLNRASDSISLSDKENQLEMHNMANELPYSEVQEHVAGNIYKYDASVQADALNSTNATGNEKAIDAAMSNYDKYTDSVKENPKYQAMQQETEARKSQEVAKQVADFHVEYEKLTGMKSSIDTQINDNDQKMAYIQQFLNATPQEQFKMISKMPMSWQGTIFEKMGLYCPQMLTSMIRQGYGKHILNTPGLPSDVICKVINIMLTNQTSDKKAAAKYVKSHKSMFSSATHERVAEIQNSNSQKGKKYVSNPNSSTVKGALYPPMCAIYENQEEMLYNA